MTITAFQLSYNGYTVGPGMDVGVLSIDGLRGMPPVLSADIPRPRGNGSFAGQNYYGERVVTMALQVMAAGTSTPFETIIADLSAAFQLITDPTGLLPMQFGMPGWAGPRQITCRPTKTAFPVNQDYAQHKALITIEMTAPDPLIYDAALQTAACGLPSPTAGLTFPVTFPVSFGASSGGSVSVTNSGTMPTYPVVTLTGPMLNPAYTLGGSMFALAIALGSGDVLVVDHQAGTVTLNGSASRYNTVVTGSAFFQIPVGTWSVGFSSADAAAVAGTMSVALRSAWGWA